MRPRAKTKEAKNTGKKLGAAVIRQEIEAEIPRAQAVEILSLRTDIMSFDTLSLPFLSVKISTAIDY